MLYDGWKAIDRRYRAALKNKPETDDADSDTEKTLDVYKRKALIYAALRART